MNSARSFLGGKRISGFGSGWMMNSAATTSSGGGDGRLHVAMATHVNNILVCCWMSGILFTLASLALKVEDIVILYNAHVTLGGGTENLR
jgi:hypothetical protein